jgi:hypothetical protein
MIVLVEELSKRVGKHKLLQVSEVEQNICASDDLAEITQSKKLLLNEFSNLFKTSETLSKTKTSMAARFYELLRFSP